MEILLKAIGVFITAIVLLFFIAVLMTLPTMWLWNWLMPILFGLKTITFWQSFGINLLSGLLFKSSTSSK